MQPRVHVNLYWTLVYYRLSGLGGQHIIMISGFVCYGPRLKRRGMCGYLKKYMPQRHLLAHTSRVATNLRPLNFLYSKRLYGNRGGPKLGAD